MTFKEYTENYNIKDDITELNCSRRDLKDLINLDCSYNNLICIDRIESLRNLTDLNCSNNKITNLKGIENLTNLKYLDCDNNPLDSPYSGSIKKEQERLKQL